MNALNRIRLPDEKEASLAKEASREITTHLQGHDVLRFKFVGEGQEDDKEIVVPAAALRDFAHMLMEIGKGHAVTVIPVGAVLTTQEAADLLNISRVYLVKLLEKGKIPYHKAGTHRRVRIEDVQAYREERARRRKVGLEKLAKLSQEIGLD